MIKVISQTLPPDTEAEQIGVLEAVGGDLKIDFPSKAGKHSQAIVLQPTALYQTPDIVVGYPYLTGQIQLVWDSEIFNTRTAYSSVLDRKGVHNFADWLFMAAFDGDDLYVVSRVPVESNSEEIEVVYEDIKTTYFQARPWFAEQSEALASMVSRNRAKRALLSQVKPEDSISYLEQQLDVVTTALIALAKSGSVPAGTLGVLEEVIKESSTARLTNTEVTDAILSNKTAIRNLQDAYFSTRS